MTPKLGFGGGVNGTAASDATIEYDENGTDELTFAGANVKFTSTKVTVNDQLIVGGNSSLGNIRIEDNIIASLAGQGNKIFIDPYPDGLSNEGDVIIKVTYKLMVQQLQLTQHRQLLMTQS